MQFDDVLIQLGQFGKYQRIQYFLLCVPGILCAFHQLAAVFLAAVPDHRCELPVSLYNETADVYEPQNDFHKSVIMTYLNTTVENSTDLGFKINDKCKFLDGDKCEAYVYTTKEIRNSVVTDWDLVCSDQIKSTISSSVYMAGVLTGAFVFGILSDYIGRKKTMLLCIFLQGASGLGSAFSPGYEVFVSLRFLTGAASMGLFMTEFVLGMELIGPKYRLVAGIVIQCFFAIGYVALTAIAFVAREWRWIEIVMSVPSFIFLIYYWFIPESARWLISRGRVEEAEAIVQNAAKVNKVELPKNVLQSLENTSTTSESLIGVIKARTLRNRALIIFLNWCVVSMGYYGLSLNSGSLGGDIYINFMLGGLVEFPAYAMCALCNKLGRKWMHVFGMMVGGLACLGTVFVDLYVKDVSDTTLTTYFVVLNMVGKFGLTMGFCIIYLWSAELYPTSLRNSLMGMSSTFARVGSIAAPFIADLGLYVPERYKRVLPASIFGATVIVGGLLSILLPETSGLSMPENIEEAKEFPNHGRDKYGESTTNSKADLTKLEEKETKFTD